MTRELGDRVFENNIYNLASIVLTKKKECRFQTYPLVKFLEKGSEKERITIIRYVLYFT